MHVLLDECLPRRLKTEIPGHDVVTVPEAGWAGKQNGEILTLAAQQFDVFVTIDQNLPAQQRIEDLRFGVVVLIAGSNRLEDLPPLIPNLLNVLDSIGPSQLVRVGG